MMLPTPRPCQVAFEESKWKSFHVVGSQRAVGPRGTALGKDQEKGPTLHKALIVHPPLGHEGPRNQPAPALL